MKKTLFIACWGWLCLCLQAFQFGHQCGICRNLPIRPTVVIFERKDESTNAPLSSVKSLASTILSKKKKRQKNIRDFRDQQHLFNKDHRGRQGNPFQASSAQKVDDSFQPTQEDIADWEKEEKELLREEQLERHRKLVAVGEEEEEEGGKSNQKDLVLPAYLERIFEQWEATEEPLPPEKLPTLVVIGRPNTGKSTFVNKLSDSYKDGAIVHDEPGITRDRTYRTASWNGYNFQVVDTGGIVFDDTIDHFAERIKHQALLALREASAAIMLCDGKEGKTIFDEELAEWLRKNNKVPIYLAVSKCESEKTGIVQAQDFWSLGLGEPYPVSGIHGTGIGDLLDIITSRHMKKIAHVLKENTTNVALIGRPNVGKSSLLNRLCGEERSIVSEIAGTTRDTVDAIVQRGNTSFRLIDTAGIRKRGKVMYGPEFFMVNRAFKAIRRSEVVILLLDALTGIVEQDRLLAQRIIDEGRACVIAVNKWDAIPDKTDKSYLEVEDHIRKSLPGLRFAEIVLISAKQGLRTERLFQSIVHSARQFVRRIPTAILNEVVSDAVLYLTPPSISSKSGRIYYTIQVSTAPPTFVFFVNDPHLFPDSYQRFLDKKIRESLRLEGTPIRMIFRGKSIREVSRDAKRGRIGHTISAVLNKKGTAENS